MLESRETLIATLLRTDTNEVRLRLRTFRGRAYVDLRVFFQPKDFGEKVPTKRGIQLPLEVLPELVAGLSRVSEFALLGEPAGASQ